MLELRYERQVHVEAPSGLVQGEIANLSQLLTYLPRADGVTVSDDGRHAKLRKTLSIGPARRAIELRTTLTQVPFNGGVDVLVLARRSICGVRPISAWSPSRWITPTSPAPPPSSARIGAPAGCADR